MKRLALISKLQTLMVVALVGLGCGSTPVTTEPAMTDLSNKGKLPELKADEIIAPPTRSANLNRPFTVQDFREKAARMGQSSNIEASTKITLSNGVTTTVGKLIEQVNKLEPGFNKLGISLRDEVSGPTLLQKTHIRLDPDATPNAQAPSLAVGATNFQSYVWKKTFGASDGPVQVSLRSDAVANSGVNDVTSTLSSGVTAVIGGMTIPVFSTSAQSSLPIPLAALDRRYAQAGYGFLGAMTPAGQYAAPGTEAHSNANLDWTVASSQVNFYGSLGPIPLVVGLGVDAHVGVSTASDVYQGEARALVGPTVATDLFANATASLWIVSLEVEGRAELVRFTPALSSQVDVTENANAPTNLDWTYGFSVEAEALSGQITVTASVDLWLLGKRSYTWVIVSWPGAQFPVFQTGAQQHLTRAPLSPMPIVAAHTEVAPSRGLGQAGDVTFGGACPAGTVRSECRAYPEQNDSVGCQVPRWASSDPHDCSCTFNVGVGPANQTQCGADVWAVPQ